MPTEPTATKILKLRGSRRVTERSRKEPAAPPGCPCLASELPLEPDEVHAELCRKLGVLGILSEVDSEIIARAAHLISRSRKTRKRLLEYPEHAKVEKWEYREARLSAEIRQLEKALGLAPSYRAGMATQKSDKADKFIKNA